LSHVVEVLDRAPRRARTAATRPRKPKPPHVLVFVSYQDLPGGGMTSPDYDTPEFRAEVDGWMKALGCTHDWCKISMTTLDAELARAAALAERRDVVVLNLCDGTEITDGFPGLSVVRGLEALGLPYTGGDPAFYALTTSKVATKTKLAAGGVPTGPWVVVADLDRDLARAGETLPFPVMVKPDISAGSVGIQVDSVAFTVEAARAKVMQLINGLHEEYRKLGGIFLEPFVEGREFTVLVIEDADAESGIYVLPPGERVFDKRLPLKERFLAYERYWGLPEAERGLPPGEPYYWYDSAPADLGARICDVARRAFRATGGRGYARMDIRYQTSEDAFYVIDVNANCGLSSDESSSVGSMLKLAGLTMSDLLSRILRNGAARGRQLRPAVAVA
jgi:D-alanine-D-alanine ligase